MHPRLLLGCAAALLLACGGSSGGSRCSSGLTDCSGTCVDTQTDEAHCGGCVGHACPTGATCDAGVCNCPAGQTPCAGACVDLQASDAHCGACGHACGLGTCQAGGCVCQGAPVTSCPASSPECVDTDTDPAHCGTCDHACSADKTGSQCSGGSCQCLDPRPDDCGSYCANLQTDASNCQSCGHVCPLTHEVCVAGACQCPASLPTTCGSSPGACVSLVTDEANCGSCGHACPSGATCSGSACSCPAATPDLCTSGNTCVNTKTDPDNCGQCGLECPPTATCSASQCSCPDGKVICGATPGQCCPGNGCCAAGACQTAHANGLGQDYYDCSAVDQYTENQAIAAAQAWAPSGTVVNSISCPACKCTTAGTQSAVWCYTGSSAVGRVGIYDGVPSCVATPGCPQQGDSNVFTWH